MVIIDHFTQNDAEDIQVFIGCDAIDQMTKTEDNTFMPYSDGNGFIDFRIEWKVYVYYIGPCVMFMHYILCKGIQDRVPTAPDVLRIYCTIAVAIPIRERFV